MCLKIIFNTTSAYVVFFPCLFIVRVFFVPECGESGSETVYVIKADVGAIKFGRVVMFVSAYSSVNEREETKEGLLE